MNFNGRNACGLFARSTGRVYVTLSLDKCGIKSRDDAKKAALKVTTDRGFPNWTSKQIKKPREAPGLCLVIGSAN